jgi:hypothetical protein
MTQGINVSVLFLIITVFMSCGSMSKVTIEYPIVYMALVVQNIVN